jgi:hypothetical protein
MPRKEERLPYLKEVELEFASGKRSARISDISPGGCYIDTISQVPVGESVVLYIASGDGQIQKFSGRVAYLLEGFGFGVEFTDLTEEHRKFLSQLFDSAG